MLDEYVDDLLKRLQGRRQAELDKLEAGAESVDLVRGRSQAYAAAMVDVQEILEAHTAPKSVPDHLQPRRSYGSAGRRVA